MQKKNVMILGPTACGKSSLAIKIANQMNGNIVNLDSKQFWKNMKHLTCAPTEEQKKKAPHFLFNCLEDYQHPNLGWWVKEIKTIPSKILVGGSIFYAKNLLLGIPEEVIISDKTQEKIKNIFNKWQFLLDNNLAENLHPNDSYRINRKIEFFLETGYDFTNFPNKYKENPYVILIEPSIIELEQNIKKRTLEFLDLAIEEVNLYKNNRNFYSIIGFQEIVDYLEKRLNKKELIDKINEKTLQYAKYQIKFLKKISHDKKIISIDNFNFSNTKELMYNIEL